MVARQLVEGPSSRREVRDEEGEEDDGGRHEIVVAVVVEYVDFYCIPTPLFCSLVSHLQRRGVETYLLRRGGGEDVSR